MADDKKNINEDLKKRFKRGQINISPSAESNAEKITKDSDISEQSESDEPPKRENVNSSPDSNKDVPRKTTPPQTLPERFEEVDKSFLEYLAQHDRENPISIRLSRGLLPPKPGEKIERLPHFYFPNKEKKNLNVKNYNDIVLAYKAALGATIRDLPGTVSALERAARALGVPYNAEDGTLRCPAGTPAANQFTNLQMSNCIVPSARTLGGAVGDAVGDAVDDAVKPSPTTVARLLGGAVNATPNEYVGGPDKTKIPLMDDLEAARRRKRYEDIAKERMRQLKVLFSDLRTDRGIRKALLQIFPNINKESLEEFVNARPQVATAEELLNFFAARANFVAGLVYEASFFNDRIKDLDVVFEDITGNPRGILYYSELKPISLNPDGSVKDKMTWTISYNTQMMVNTIIPDENFLSLGNLENFDDIGQHQYHGTHEFGHLLLVMGVFDRMGIKPEQWSRLGLIEWFYDEFKPKLESFGVSPFDDDWSAATLSDEEKRLGRVMAQIMKIHYQTDDKDAAYKVAREMLEKVLSFHGGTEKHKYKDSTGADQEQEIDYLGDDLFFDLDKQFGDGTQNALLELLGSKYAIFVGVNPDGTSGEWSPVELYAELFAAMRYFPEYMYEGWDKLRSKNSNLPELDEIWEHLTGLDTKGKKLQVPEMRQLTRRDSRLRKFIAGYRGKTPKKRRVVLKEPPLPTDEEIQDLAKPASSARAQTQRIQNQRAINQAVSSILDYYTQDEIRDIIDALPLQDRYDKDKFDNLILNSVPEKLKNLRSPSGVASTEELAFNQLLAEAIRDGHISYEDFLAKYIERGGFRGPRESIRRQISAAIGRAAANRRARKSKPSLGGAMSLDDDDLEDATILNHSAANYGVYNPLFGVPPTPGQSRDYLSPGARAEFDRRWPPKPNKDRGVPTATAWMKDLTDQELIDEILAHYAFAGSTQVLTLEERRHQKETMAALLKEKRRRNLWVGRKYQGRPGGQRRPSPNQQNQPLPTVNPTPVSPTPTPVSPTPTPVSPTPTPQPRPPKPTKPNTPTPQPAKPNQPLPTPGPQPTPSTPSPGTNRPTSPGKKIPQPANKTDQEFFDDWTKADFGDEVIPGWVKVKPSSGKDGDLEIQYTKDGRTFTIERKTDSRGNEIYELWEWHTGTEGGNTPHGRESAENSNAIYNLIDTHSKLVGQPNPLDDDDTADDLTTKQNDLVDDYDSARVGDEVIDGWKKFDQVSFEDGEEVRTLINDSGTGVIFQRKTKDGKIKYDFALVDQNGNLIDEGKDYDSFDGVVNKINRAQVSNDEDNDEFEEIQDIIDSNNIDKASRVDIPSGTAPDGWSTTKETRTTPKGRKTIDLGFTHTSENYYDDDADRRYKVQEYIDPNTGQRKLRVREENRKDASDRWSTDNEVILGNFDNWDDVNSAIANRQNQRRPDERHFDRNGWSLERGRDGEVASQVLETETRRRGQTTETVPTTTQRTWTPQNNDPNGPQYKIHEFNNQGTNIYVVSRHELNDDGTEDVVNIPFQSWPEARLAVEDDQNNISRLNAGDSVALPTRRGQQTTDGLTDAPSGPGLKGWKKRTLTTRKFYPTGEKDKNGNWIQRPAYVGIEYMPDDFDDDDSPVKYSIISSTNPRTPNYTVHRHVRRDDGTYDIQSGEYDTWADALDAIEQDRNAVNAAIADGWNPNERPAKPRAVIADIDDRSGGQGDYIEPELKQLSDEELIRRYEGIRKRFLDDRQKAIDENENFPASRRTRLNNYEDELQTRGLMVFDGGAPDPLDEEEGYAEIDGQIIDIETGEIISLKTDDKPSLGGGMSYVSRTSIPDASRGTVNMRPRERQKTRKLKPRQPLGPQAYEIEFDLLNNPKYAKAMEFLAFYGKHDGPSSITNINQLDNIVNRMKRIKLRGKNNKPLADDSEEMKNWYEAISKISEMYHTNLMEIDDPDNNIMIVDEGVNTDDVRQKLPSNTRFIKPNNTDLDDSEIGQPGVSQRKIRRITNNERRRLGGAMSGATNVGSVKRDDGDVVTSKPYRPIELDKVEKLGYFKDGEESVDTLPVYTIGNKKIAFGSTLYGNEQIEFDGVEVVPLNPYVISNNSIESDAGRQIAVDWWNATAGAVSENPDNGALASALLYAAARGDEDARIEFERLAKIGSDIRSEEIDRNAKKIIDAASGIDWTATDRYTANDHIVWDGDTKRPVELRDLIAVHQTNYEPTIDADGNLILRPVEDYGDNRRDETDGPLRFHRGSLHLSLNHLVTGHIGRQSPTGKTFAIAFNLEEAIKANPDSLDNLYAVDTIMTPKPGQGLTIPKGSFEFIELPSAESLGIKIPPPVDRQKITTQQMQENTKISEQFQKAQQKAVEELLSTLGKRFNGESYTTPIFPGGEHGSTGPLQNRLAYLAALERVQSNLHNYLPHREFEKISAYNDSKERNISRIANPRTSQLSINAIMRIAASDRFTSAKTTSDGGSVSGTNRNNFMPPDRAQNFLAD